MFQLEWLTVGINRRVALEQAEPIVPGAASIRYTCASHDGADSERRHKPKQQSEHAQFG